jgi:hypothetical protein
MEIVVSVDRLLQLGAFAVLAWLLLQRRGDKAAETMREQLAAADKRISVLETTVEHMPTHGDMQSIQRELRDLNARVSGLDERSENLLDMVRTVQQHLLEQSE